MRRLKQLLFGVCKRLGLFCIARQLTRKSVRILAYHAFAEHDEYLFRPKLFIRRKTFAQRLQIIKSTGYPVVSLDAAVSGLDSGGLPGCAVVITIDDGFYSTYSCAAKALHAFAFPSTVYVTTYYSGKQTPVFNLLIQYIFWKTRETVLTLPAGAGPLSGLFELSDPSAKSKVMWTLVRAGQIECDEPARQAFASTIAQSLKVDISLVRANRIFNIMAADEIRAASALGVNAQMHTHRHRTDAARLANEIADNRAALESVTDGRLTHFCYPRGVWSTEHWPPLEAAGVRSAVTCDVGFNYQETPKLALKRFLDSEDVTPIEFEAELSGFAELLRIARTALGGRRASAPMLRD